MVDEGHEVAIHGWSHRSTLAIRPTHLARQLEDAKHAVEAITGSAASWYRPPYGVLSLGVARRTVQVRSRSKRRWRLRGADQPTAQLLRIDGLVGRSAQTLLAGFADKQCRAPDPVAVWRHRSGVFGAPPPSLQCRHRVRIESHASANTPRDEATTCPTTSHHLRPRCPRSHRGLPTLPQRVVVPRHRTHHNTGPAPGTPTIWGALTPKERR